LYNFIFKPIQNIIDNLVILTRKIMLNVEIPKIIHDPLAHNKHLTNYGQKKSKNCLLLLFINGQANILVCPICQKLANCA
jgi:hypothetical protein